MAVRAICTEQLNIYSPCWLQFIHVYLSMAFDGSVIYCTPITADGGLPGDAEGSGLCGHVPRGVSGLDGPHRRLPDDGAPRHRPVRPFRIRSVYRRFLTFFPLGYIA